VGGGGVAKLIQLAQNRERWLAIVYAVLNVPAVAPRSYLVSCITIWRMSNN
jgi:hypothetical protein